MCWNVPVKTFHLLLLHNGWPRSNMWHFQVAVFLSNTPRKVNKGMEEGGRAGES